MIGKTFALLHSPQLGGFVVQVQVQRISKPKKPRLVWLPTVQLRHDGQLEANANSILEGFIDPLARIADLELPQFEIAIEKAQWWAYRDKPLKLGGQSMSVALLAGMVSSFLEIPLAQETTATGQIDPPFSHVKAVRGILGKALATSSFSNSSRLLVPDPGTQFQRMSIRPEDASEYETDYDVLKESYPGKLVSVKGTDDIWPHFFPPELVLHQALSNQVIYDVCNGARQSDAIYGGLLKYLETILEGRWEHLRNAIQSDGVNGFHRVFPAIMAYYVTNGVNPKDIYGNIRSVLSLPVLVGRTTFEFSDWARISRLFSLDQYDELLRLLLIANNPESPEYEVDEFECVFANTEFKESLRDIIIKVAQERDFFTLLQTLVVLIRKFTAERVIPDVREDLYELLKNRFFDRWTESYERCCEQLDHIRSSELESPRGYDELLSQSTNAFEPFRQTISSNLRILDSLVAVDPVLVVRLRSHECFARVAERVNQSVNLMQSEVVERQGKQRAQLDIELFGKLWERIKQFDDRIGSRISISHGRAELVPDEATMTIRVDSDLTSMEFSIQEYAKRKFPEIKEAVLKGNNTVLKPVLLWPESLNLPAYWKPSSWSRDGEEVLNLPDGHFLKVDSDGKEVKQPGLIPRLFSHSYIDVVYDDISIRWSLQFRWPPSIDSLFFAKTLADHGYNEKSVQNVADIGCGSGFLGIALAKRNPKVSQLCAVDVATSLTMLTEYNIRRNLSSARRQDMSIIVSTGSGLEAAKDFGSFDLVVCAPPYLPERERYQEALSLESPVNGTDLLEEVIISGRQLAREVVMEMSEIALPEFEQAVESVGAKATLLNKMLVPVRIPPIFPYTPYEQRLEPGTESWENALIQYKKLKRYTDMLVSERGLRVLDERNFKYWQEIQVYSITY